MMFSDAYAACNVCSPTRASIMSGQYPARTKITDWIRPDRAIKTPADWVPSLTGKPVEGKGIRTALNLPFLPLEVVTIAELLKKEGYRTAHVGKWHLGREEFYPEHQGFDFNRGGGEWGQPYKGYFDPYGGDTVCDVPIISTDILPTICQVVGAPLPGHCFPQCSKDMLTGAVYIQRVSEQSVAPATSKPAAFQATSSEAGER